MKVTELPVVFDCEGVSLVGIIHIPEQPHATGILTIAAGGIQYRAGCGRQLVTIARSLAAQGTPVMRFDHRGHGDSVGELLGFQHMEKDLARALEVFRETVPALEHIVLYGGCEAASAIMISAWNLPLAKSAILANPWVDSDQIRAQVSRNHYLRRLREPTFWKKLFSFQYNLLDYAAGAGSLVKKKIAAVLSPGRKEAVHSAGKSEVHFEERMLSGFQKFTGPVLFLKSGMSFIAEEFDLLVASSDPWQQACNRKGIRRTVLPGADQAISTAAARNDLCRAAAEWVAQMNDRS